MHGSTILIGGNKNRQSFLKIWNFDFVIGKKKSRSKRTPEA